MQNIFADKFCYLNNYVNFNQTYLFLNSGKLRGMHSIMQKSIDKLDDYFDRLSNNENGIMDTKNIIAGFTIDVIGNKYIMFLLFLINNNNNIFSINWFCA